MRQPESTLVAVAAENPVLCKLIQFHLGASGIAMAEYSTPADLLAGLTPQIRLCLLTLTYPGQSGLDLLASLHQVRPGLPVIFLPRVNEIREARETLAHGAFYYLSQPLDPVDLVHLVQLALRNHSGSPSSLPPAPPEASPLLSASGAPPGSLAGLTLAAVEKRALAETLAYCRGNKAETARVLGIAEKSVYNMMKRYGL